MQKQTYTTTPSNVNLCRRFRTEVFEAKKKKRPTKGSNRRFKHFDFHDERHAEVPNLHGIIIIGGCHHRGDMEEEAETQDQPGTPPPLSGRQHCQAQTDIYLEDIADNEVDFNDAEIQCEPIYDDIGNEDSGGDAGKQNDKNETTTSGTQLDEWVFSDIAFAYDQISTDLADAVIMESLRQLQEEHELEALRKQHELHQELRAQEIAILEKFKLAQAKYDAQKNKLERRKPWDEDIESVKAQVEYDKMGEAAADQAEANEQMQDEAASINAEVLEKVNNYRAARLILDAVIENSNKK